MRGPQTEEKWDVPEYGGLGGLVREHGPFTRGGGNMPSEAPGKVDGPGRGDESLPLTPSVLDGWAGEFSGI